MAGIYCHIPFCEKKCIYCDFYSITTDFDFNTFTDFILEEINLSRKLNISDPVETIYFGGGTPSLLSQKHFEKIIEAINKNFHLSTNPEITIEVNPGTVNFQKLDDFRRIGINRISIGVQSFFDTDLKFLSRIHNSEQALKCIDDARKAGFENLGIDLIFAVPTQTSYSWEQNLLQAVKLKPEHLSVYNLSVEKNTPLHQMIENKETSLVSETVERKMFEIAIERLTSAGFCHYEISNYAKPGFESKHNSNYWNHSNYLGIGPAAHSYMNGKRWWNVNSLPEYYARIGSGDLPILESEKLSKKQIINEMIMLGLRTNGANFTKMKFEYGFDYKMQLQSLIDNLVEDKLAILKEGVLILTKNGILICDEISRMLISNLEIK